MELSEPNSINNQIEININFYHDLKFTIPEDSKLSHLKDLINNEFLIKEDEYEIFIKDVQLLIINGELNLKNLIETYGTNEFIVKSFKSKFLLI